MARKSLPGPRSSRKHTLDRPVTPWLDPAAVFAQEPGDIEKVAYILGIDGDVSGDELVALCPMHDDRSPSFGISLLTGAWLCRAGCAQGSLAWLVALATGCSMAEAQGWLGDDVQPGDCTPNDEYDVELSKWVEWEYWRDRRRPPDEALAARGISAEVADELAIKWGTTWQPELRMYTSASGFQLPVRQMLTYQIMGWQTKIDQTSLRIMGALRGYTPDAVVKIHRDEIGAWTSSGTPKSLSLFGVDVFDPGSTAILLESPLDVAVLRTHGLEGGLASYGKPSRPQLRYLAENAGSVVLAMDNDKAGYEYLDFVMESGYFLPKIAAGELFLFNYGSTGTKDIGALHDRPDAVRDGFRHAVPVTTRLYERSQSRRWRGWQRFVTDES